MPRTSFEASLGFAFAVALLGGLCFLYPVPESLGFGLEASCLWLTVAAYLWVIGGSSGSAVVASLVGFSCLSLFDRLRLGSEHAAAAAAITLGTLRSRFCSGSDEPGLVPRVLLEVGLGAGALVAARVLHGPGGMDLALTLFGFWLVHAAHPLLQGSSAESSTVAADPFDTAQGRARELLAELSRACPGTGHPPTAMATAPPQEGVTRNSDGDSGLGASPSRFDPGCSAGGDGVPSTAVQDDPAPASGPDGNRAAAAGQFPSESGRE